MCFCTAYHIFSIAKVSKTKKMCFKAVQDSILDATDHAVMAANRSKGVHYQHLTMNPRFLVNIFINI